MSTLRKDLDPLAFAEIFNASVEGILVIDGSGKIMVANPACQKLFGYDNSLVGKKIEALIPDRKKEKHISHRRKYNVKPQNRPMGHGLNLVGKRKDGSEIPVEVSLSHTTYDGQFVTLAFVIDISDRIKAENALKKSEEQLIIYATELEKRVRDRTRELEKVVKKLKSEVVVRKRAEQEAMVALSKQKELNELKTRFVSMASHEFRTPLSTILSSASLISRYKGNEDMEKRNKHIERIKVNVNELTGILNDFLLLGRLEEGKVMSYPEQISLVEFVNDVITEMSLVLKRGQEIVFAPHHKELQVFLDRQVFKNILVNILSNAIKYSEEGKKIFIKLTKKSKKFEIAVTDQGMGIPKDDQLHLFERFFRARNVTNIQGTGLGLNLVKKYLSLMNGKINYESVEGEGSTFNIILPLKMK